MNLAFESLLSSPDFCKLGLDATETRNAIARAKEIRTGHFPSVTKELFMKTVSQQIEALQSGKDFTLFGTSGMRGKVEDIREKAVSAYKSGQIMSYKLAYLYGKAYGIMLNAFPLPVRDPFVLKEVSVGMDTRAHSLPMAACLMEGLQEEGIRICFLGVAPTPCGNLFGNSIIITASHNPPEQDGIKAFVEKRPITFDMERTVESIMRVLENLEMEGKTFVSGTQKGSVQNGQTRMIDAYRHEIMEMLEENGLIVRNKGGITERRLTGTLTPLDLAYGAAACYYTSDGIFQLSQQIQALLESGTTLVGYGIVRDGQRTNYGIGAAYIYGETAERMKPEEIRYFSQGKFGYGQTREGAAHPRSFFFGKDHAWKQPELKSQGLTVESGETVFLHVAENGKVAGLLDREIESLTVLPACSVDCDEDRYLATSPDLAGQSIPYLSGDAAIALFSYFYRDRINKVIFTVESGMALQKILEADQRDYEIVTVGDRAIADWIYDCPEDLLPAGGEPSGHVIFKGGKDDPIYTHILLMGILLAQKKPLTQINLSALVEKATHGIKEIYTDRSGARPKTEGKDGISLSEKSLLELKSEAKGEKIRISEYAIQFIPWCVSLFGNGWKDLFSPELSAEIRPASEFSALLRDDLIPPLPYAHVPVGEIRIGKTTIAARARFTSLSYFGPNDITITFYEKIKNKESVCGEMVSRNSGTSPKNSCYIKMWPTSESQKKSVPLPALEEKLKEMGKQRVDFTCRYIFERRKS